MPSHGLFARYGHSGSDAWSREYRLSVNDLRQSKSLYIAGFAFDVLTLAALICGIVWACMIRNHRGALEGVLTSLFTWLMYVDRSLHLRHALTEQLQCHGSNHHLRMSILG